MSKKASTNKMLLYDYRQRWFTWGYSGLPSSIINFDNETILKLFLKPM
jgi:RNA-directed DNA polymerase